MLMNLDHQHDVLILGGTVIDGTRAPRRQADVGVRNGRISAIGHLTQHQAARTIDASGCIVAPGFIDAHRHINTGPNEKQQMQALLEAGYTTILSGGGPADGNLTLRQHIESGQINGPRILPSGSIRINAQLTPGAARAFEKSIALIFAWACGERRKYA